MPPRERFRTHQLSNARRVESIARPRWERPQRWPVPRRRNAPSANPPHRPRQRPDEGARVTAPGALRRLPRRPCGTRRDVSPRSGTHHPLSVQTRSPRFPSRALHLCRRRRRPSHPANGRTSRADERVRRSLGYRPANRISRTTPGRRRSQSDPPPTRAPAPRTRTVWRANRAGQSIPESTRRRPTSPGALVRKQSVRW